MTKYRRTDDYMVKGKSMNIGIIGGIGPASTVAYYQEIINRYREKTNDDNYPQIFINSINMTKMLGYVAEKNYKKLANMLVSEINKLEAIGADYVALASNTPHIVIDEISEKIKIPIISIVEETCKYANKKNIKKVLLTGTLFTMQSNFYKKSFEKYNIECIVPNDKDKETIQKIIFPNLVNGIIIDNDKKKFIDLCNAIIKENSIDGLILGCTELPLIANKSDFNIAVINTMEIHINSILEKMM